MPLITDKVKNGENGSRVIRTTNGVVFWPSMTCPSSAIGILTFKRPDALKTVLTGIERHCGKYPLAIAEDCGLFDTTADLLKSDKAPISYRHDMLADVTTYHKATAFIGRHNLGVSGNTNRLIKWFMEETKADHLCLLNDDLIVSGDFVTQYREAHQDIGIQLFCFCDFTSDTYKWASVPIRTPRRNYVVKVMPRMTGIMMSVSRSLIERIGYFDTAFGKFGEEHCDFTNRARFAGAMRLHNQDLPCADIELSPSTLKHQDIPSSISPEEKPRLDDEATYVLSRVAKTYTLTDWYRPFRLVSPRYVGAYEHSGIAFERLNQYPLLVGSQPKDAWT